MRMTHSQRSSHPWPVFSFLLCLAYVLDTSPRSIFIFIYRKKRILWDQSISQTPNVRFTTISLSNHCKHLIFHYRSLMQCFSIQRNPAGVDHILLHVWASIKYWEVLHLLAHPFAQSSHSRITWPFDGSYYKHGRDRYRSHVTRLHRRPILHRIPHSSHACLLSMDPTSFIPPVSFFPYFCFSRYFG